MNAGPDAKPFSRWSHWYRRALPAYWLFLFCATHFPRLKIEANIPKSDKILHFVAFGILAFLFWRFVETFERPLSNRFVWLTAATLGLYAALDEYLQQFVERGMDFADWLCDMGGVALVLAFLEWRRRRERQRSEMWRGAHEQSPKR